jgi:hypothetical protein
MKTIVRLIPIAVMPILLVILPTVTVYGQQEQEQQHQTTPSNSTTPYGPFLNLANTTWQMYNESSGSTSTLTFNNNDTYTRMLHGNELTGPWSSRIITAQLLQLCPGESQEGKWMPQCLNVLLRVNGPNSAEFTDSHGSRIHLMK